MADEYGFTIKTKSNAGPRIKYLSAYFNSDADAIGFATRLDAVLANNAKATCQKKLVKVQESAYEIPSDQMNLRDEVWTLISLKSKDDNGNVVGQGLMTLPCAQAGFVSDFVASLPADNIYLPGGGEVMHKVTDAEIVRTTAYAL